MAREGGGVAQDDELHAGAGDGHVHAAQVAQEAYLALVVGAHEAYEYHVALLALEAVDGVDRNQVAVGLEIGRAAHQAAQQLHLGAVGRDDAHVDALVEHVLAAYLLKVVVQGVEREQGLVVVDAPEAGAHKVLLEVHAGGVDPRHGGVEVEDAAVAHLGGAHDLAVVEPLAREVHDGLVHAEVF